MPNPKSLPTVIPIALMTYGYRVANTLTFAIQNNITEKIEIPAEANIKTLKSDNINTNIIFNVWNGCNR